MTYILTHNRSGYTIQVDEGVYTLLTSDVTLVYNVYTNELEQTFHSIYCEQQAEPIIYGSNKPLFRIMLELSAILQMGGVPEDTEYFTRLAPLVSTGIGGPSFRQPDDQSK